MKLRINKLFSKTNKKLIITNQFLRSAKQFQVLHFFKMYFSRSMDYWCVCVYVKQDPVPYILWTYRNVQIWIIHVDPIHKGTIDHYGKKVF